MERTFRRLFRALGWLAVCCLVILSLVPAETRPQTGAPGQFEHGLAYALTAATLGIGYHGSREQVRTVGGLIGLAAVLEFAQRWVTGRTSQIIDVVASAAGTAVGALLVFVGLLAFSQLNERRQRRL